MGQCYNYDDTSAVSAQYTEITNADWADAVTKNNMVAIRIMHSNDPGIINQPIDLRASRALHFAVKNKHGTLLNYLLKNGADVNMKGGPDMNTALHEAVILNDVNVVRKLFGFGASDTELNLNKKKAIELCRNTMRREFYRAKKYGGRTAKSIRDDDENTENDILLAGMDLNSTSRQKIKAYEKETSGLEDLVRKTERDIESRDEPVTLFGEKVGVDVDEIALALQRLEAKSRIWSKLSKKQSVLQKQTEIYKVLFALTLMVMRVKNPRAKQPDKQAIRDLTVRVCKKLPKKKGKTMLTKKMFETKFAKLLFDVHAGMVAEETEEEEEEEETV